MKTIQLADKFPSLDQLLSVARRETVLLVSEDGSRFVLEAANDFDQEVFQLGQSENFMRFIEKRSQERSITSIEEFINDLK